MFGPRHYFMLAPMETISFASLPDPTAAAIDTAFIELPSRYEVAQTKHTLIYPTVQEARDGKRIELELTFKIRRVAT